MVGACRIVFLRTHEVIDEPSGFQFFAPFLT